MQAPVQPKIKTKGNNGIKSEPYYTPRVYTTGECRVCIISRHEINIFTALTQRKTSCLF